MNPRFTFRRVLAVVSATVLTAGLLAACGSSKSSSSGAAASPVTSTAGTSTTAASGGIANAVKTVDEFTTARPFVIAPLPKPAQKGVYLASVNCTIPACQPAGTAAPATALGWRSKEFPYDLTKGPSDFVTAVRQAIASKPQALVINMVFPETLIAPYIAAAAKAGMKIVDIGGSNPHPNYIACVQCATAVALGHLMGDIALADAGKPVSAGIVLDKTTPVLVTIANAAAAELKTNGEGSKSQILNQSLAAPASNNVAAVISFLQRNPDVNYLIYTTPGLLPGVHAALSAAGLASRVKIVVDSPNTPGDIDLVKQGQLLAWAAGEGAGGYFWRAVDAAARALQGAPLNPFAPPGYLRIVSKDNASTNPTDLIAPPNFQQIYKQAWHVG